MSESEGKKLSAVNALVLFVLSILMVFGGVLWVKANSSIVLLTAGIVSSAVCMIWGIKWKDLERDMLSNINAMLPAILILLSVGLMIGIWIACWTVPLMVYYGIKILSPGSFLAVTLVVCTMMSVCMGTSWGTIGTVGVALMGVSAGLEIPLAYTAGAIVTGAIFGDKLSPLSDTTVMSSAVSGVDIIDHIKYMLWTTIPPYLISLALYLFLGRAAAGRVITGGSVEIITSSLSSIFSLSPILLLPPVAVLGLIILKKPALPVFTVGVALGCVLAYFCQGMSLGEISSALQRGYTAKSEIGIIDSMLIRGGLNSMLSSVVLLMAAAVFGAPLKTAGVIAILIDMIKSKAASERIMQVFAFITHAAFFCITGSYYVTFAVLGPVMRPLYDSYSLHRANISRMLEDSGTALAPIVPWSVTGAFIANTLGVPTGEYIMYAPLTYLGMVFLVIYDITGVKIWRKPAEGYGELN
ncbi:MAG: Na+/H+ antiporter NhaC [Synergistaceae bacterium]|nr:Na+/H+ antiporter NhaC [Synergistaceae bacterium]